MNSHRIFLASASPRRHELLGWAGIPHTVYVTDAEEEPVGACPDSMTPAEWYAYSASRAKADAAVKALKPKTGDIIVAADTLVTPDGIEVMGKPKDAEDARRMLRSLSDREHLVIGGITVTDGVKTVTKTVTTRVTMKELSDSTVDKYIATGEPFGKAGSYAIQGIGSVLVSGIVGDYANVVGISLSVLREILVFDFFVDMV